MAVKIFKVFVVIVLLSLPTSGQNSQQHLICQNAESVSSDGHDYSTVSHSRRIQGRTGKPGPAGVKGEPGLPGRPAVVDYERISQVIEEKHREGMREMESRFAELKRNITQLQTGMQEMNSQFEELQRNITDLDTELTLITEQTSIVRGIYKEKGQRCKEENGLPFDGKCFFLGYLSTSSKINYNQAVQKCSSQNSLIAELHSMAHQKAIQDFFRSRIPSSRSYIYLWLGMAYQGSERNLRFRSGKEVSVDQFEWGAGYPRTGSWDKILIDIRKDSQDRNEGLFNEPATSTVHGVICEKRF